MFRYIQQHGSFSGFAPYASDAVSLIVNATRLANSVDRGRLRVYLETLVLEGIAASYAFAPIGHGGMEGPTPWPRDQRLLGPGFLTPSAQKRLARGRLAYRPTAGGTV